MLLGTPRACAKVSVSPTHPPTQGGGHRDCRGWDTEIFRETNKVPYLQSMWAKLPQNFCTCYGWPPKAPLKISAWYKVLRVISGMPQLLGPDRSSLFLSLVSLIFPTALCKLHCRGSDPDWDHDGSFGSPTNPKPGGPQSDWVKNNAKSGGGRNEEYYGTIEDDNRKAHVKFRKENPIFYEQGCDSIQSWNVSWKESQKCHQNYHGSTVKNAIL